ncbi:MAG: DUF1552 domain-containing protein [Gemmataceae bacterium]
MNNARISRRTMLKGLGTAIALPCLEGMAPLLAAGGRAAAPAPLRLAVVYVPNGINMVDWTPTGEGKNYELPSILRPLQPVRDKVLVLTGLTADKARANGDGPGDHARAMSAFLTGAQPRKTHGADIRAGISLDQLVAQRIGRETRFASLEIGCEGSRQVGNCDSGYSCAYSSCIAWRTESTPLPKEIDPRLVFERLFSGTARDEVKAARQKREQYNKSILDFVMEDTSQLRGQLGANDQRKLDEYLSSIREIEHRLSRLDREPTPAPSGFDKPAGVPRDYRDHLRIMSDLLVLAFRTDLTRVNTFVYANEGSNRNYAAIGVSEGHHYLSHHGNDPAKKEKIRKINHFHMEQFAYFLRQLDTIPEGDGTLLDHCMILYGCGNSDGNRHNHDDLPILLAGGGGGTLQSGRHIRYPKETPLTNLFLSMLDRLGIHEPRFGDSTGRLTGLA